MKQLLLWILVAFSTAVSSAPQEAALSIPELRPAQHQAQAANMVSRLLGRYHYKATPLDDALSAKIFDQYLKMLDSEKVIFTQGDVDQLSALRLKIDDAILTEDLGGPFSMFNLYARRTAERFAYARSLLKTRFDFSQSENYKFEREKEAWLSAESQVQDLWRKRVKNDWLRLKLAGKDDKSIVETLDKRYEGAIKRVARLKSEDAFQTFMTAYTMAIEPHTNYLGPRAAEDFGISMRLSLVGIGAVLADRDDYTTIRELVPGGPAALSGQVKVGDRIIGVAQGRNGAMTDVTGWRLDDTVALIRGAPDSVVELDILAADAGPDGKHSVVSLVRKSIALEEQAAKKSVVTVAEGKITRRIGVIALPSFYMDFEARRKGTRDYRSASRDVARMLGEFRNENVDAVLVDLRNNGGGSLVEAVDLTGLFIDKGPVVQQRDANGAISVERDTNAGVAWDGPLGVLINRGSASASEIFAAAIQDYGRGVVIGEPSFGKGTVQSMVDLDRAAKSGKPQLGGLRMTIAQFFRINGGTTQLRGVKPDIAFPSMADPDNSGESSYENALPWTQISAVSYAPSTSLKGLLPILQLQHDARVKSDRDFQVLQEEIAEARVQRKRTSISLNEGERRKERDAQELRARAREIRKAANMADGAPVKEAPLEVITALRDDGLQANERSIANDVAAEKRRKAAKDLFLNEAAHILSDNVELQKSGGRFAEIRPGQGVQNLPTAAGSAEVRR